MKHPIWTAALLIAASTLPTSVRAQKTIVAPTELDAALPADTLLYVRVSSVQDLVSKLKASPLSKLGAGEDFAPLIAQVEEQWTAATTQIHQEMGVDVAQLLGSCQGELSLVVGGVQKLAAAIGQSLASLEEPNIKPEMVPVLLAIDSAKGKDDFAKNWNSLIEFGKKNGIPVETQSFHGGKVTTVTKPEGAADGPDHVFLGEHSGRYFVSLSKEFLEQTIANLKPGAASGLSKVAEYASTKKMTGGGGDMFVYINVKSLTAAVDAALNTSMFAFFWTKFNSVFIGKSLNGIAMSSTIEKKGIRSRGFVHNNGGSDGVFGWFKAPPISPTPSPLIPPEAQTFSSVSLNVKKMFGAIREVAQTVMAFQGAGASLDDIFQQQLGLSLSELEGSLGQRFHTFTLGSTNPAMPLGETSFVFELQDEGPIKKLLEKLAEMSGGQFAPAKFLNRDIYTIAGAPGVSPTFTASDKLFVVGMSQPAVEKVIQRVGEKTSAFGGDAAFRAATKDFVPGQVNSIGYTHQDYFAQSLETVGEMLQLGAPIDVPSEVYKLVTAFGRTFGPSVNYMKWEDQGLYSEGWISFR